MAYTFIRSSRSINHMWRFLSSIMVMIFFFLVTYTTNMSTLMELAQLGRSMDSRGNIINWLYKGTTRDSMCHTETDRKGETGGERKGWGGGTSICGRGTVSFSGKCCGWSRAIFLKEGLTFKSLFDLENKGTDELRWLQICSQSRIIQSLDLGLMRTSTMLLCQDNNLIVTRK